MVEIITIPIYLPCLRVAEYEYLIFTCTCGRQIRVFDKASNAKMLRLSQHPLLVLPVSTEASLSVLVAAFNWLETVCKTK